MWQGQPCWSGPLATVYWSAQHPKVVCLQPQPAGPASRRAVTCSPVQLQLQCSATYLVRTAAELGPAAAAVPRRRARPVRAAAGRGGEAAA